jgi:glycosyl transferase family 25
MPPLPVFYINLAGRSDRRAHIEGQLARLGLEAVRVDAVPAAGPVPAIVAPHVDPRAGFFLAPPVAACTMSHLLCWTQFLSLADAPEWALVLEDDAVLSDSLPAFLAAFLSVAGSVPADVVQLEVHVRPVRVLPPTLKLASGHHLAKFRSTRHGCACYLISRRAISILTARRDLFRQPIDLTLFRPFAGPGRSIRSLLADPGLAVQLDESGSDRPESRSDIAVERFAPMWPGRRRIGRILMAMLNLADHALHLPRGIRSKIVRFDGDIVPTGLSRSR